MLSRIEDWVRILCDGPNGIFRIERVSDFFRDKQIQRCRQFFGDFNPQRNPASRQSKYDDIFSAVLFQGFSQQDAGLFPIVK